MKKNEVPQDPGMNDGMKEITYAVDENGRYTMIRSLGWEHKNVANTQAWDIIEARIAETVCEIRSGRKSPLAYHMEVNLMNVGLTAEYAGFSRWRVLRHLKPKVFARLDPAILQVYADIFRIPVEKLSAVPDTNPSP